MVQILTTHQTRPAADLPLTDLYQRLIGPFYPTSLMGWVRAILWLVFQLFREIFADLKRSKVLDEVLLDVFDFVDHFESRYGDVHPTILLMSYTQALKLARARGQFLLVFIHKEQMDSFRFSRDVIINEEFCEFVDAQMLFWICDFESIEGLYVSERLGASSFPFCAVLFPINGLMTIVGRIEGYHSAESTMVKLLQVIASRRFYQTNVNYGCNTFAYNKMLTEQWEDEFDATLKAAREDFVRNNIKQKTMVETDSQFSDLLDFDERQEQLAIDAFEHMETRAWRVKLFAQLPREPLLSDPKTIRVLVRYPLGQWGLQVERRFKTGQALMDVYKWVSCHDWAPTKFNLLRHTTGPNLPTDPRYCAVKLDYLRFAKLELLYVESLDE